MHGDEDALTAGVTPEVCGERGRKFAGTEAGRGNEGCDLEAEPKAGAGDRTGGKSGHYCLTRQRKAVRLSIVKTSEGASQIDRSR